MEGRVQCPALGLVSDTVLWKGVQSPGSQRVLGESSRKGPSVPGVLPHPLHSRPSTSAGPGGQRGSIFLPGMALLFSDELCLFLGVGLSSSFLSCPSHPEGRVVITGLLCLWWARQRPCFREAGLLSLPLLTSQLPKDYCACGVLTFLSGIGCLGVMMPQWAPSPHGGGFRCSGLTASFQPPAQRPPAHPAPLV